MIHPASYKTCRKAVDRAFELFPQKIAGKKTEDTDRGCRAGDACGLDAAAAPKPPPCTLSCSETGPVRAPPVFGEPAL